MALPTTGEPFTAVLNGQTFVAVRTLPPSALSAERLESAGEGRGDDGSRIAMARADTPEAAPWELVSPSPAGWRIWRPKAVLAALARAGAQAQLSDVMALDWPDSCLGIAEPGRVCAQVITPGYRIIVESAGRNIEYHTDRSGERILEAPG